MKWKKRFKLNLKASVLIISLCSWGFSAHKELHRISFSGLPSPLFEFCKSHQDYLISEAIAPDRRKHSDSTEAIKHYIDLDLYDSTLEHGTLPWTVSKTYNQLVHAFTNCKDTDYILKLMVDLGHYVGDAHVPLHTTSNYNGQLSGQTGIHALWETHVYELQRPTWQARKINTFYIGDVEAWIWDIIYSSNELVEEVLSKEQHLRSSGLNTMGYRTRGRTLDLLPTPEFCSAFSQSMGSMVEHRFYQSADNISSAWYSAWIDAGSPPLECLDSNRELTQQTQSPLLILRELFSLGLFENQQKQEPH